jgi:hypothetical protein
VGGRIEHVDAGAAFNPNPTGGLERDRRLSNRDAAHAKVFGKLSFSRKPGARLETTVPDELQDSIRNALEHPSVRHPDGLHDWMASGLIQTELSTNLPPGLHQLRDVQGAQTLGAANGWKLE